MGRVVSIEGRPGRALSRTGMPQGPGYVSPFETLESVKGRVRAGSTVERAVARERVKRGQPPGCNDPHWRHVFELAEAWDESGRPGITHAPKGGAP